MSADPSDDKPRLLLSLNAGSSSLKAALFRLEQVHHLRRQSPSLVAVVSISSIASKTAASADLTFHSPSKSQHAHSHNTATDTDPFTENIGEINDHEAAIKQALALLFDHDRSHRDLDRSSVTHVAHRVVHGGSLFTAPVELTKERLGKLHELTALAPLHNTPAERVVRVAADVMGHAKQYAFFDTSFHASLREEVYTYPLPLETCRKKKIRKYGFHGLSYAFVTKRVHDHLDKSAYRGSGDKAYRLILLHLGSGASACAVKGGKSLDTTMGYTPVDGLMMGTRPGAVDPTAVLHLFDDPNQATEMVNSDNSAGENAEDKSSIARAVPQPPLTRIEDLLNHDCGFKGITGVSSLSEVRQRAAKESPSSSDSPNTLAVNMFVHRVKLVVGGYAALLGGVDALVFTGGSGAKWWEVRERICAGLECMGVSIDAAKNREKQVGSGRGVVWDVTREEREGNGGGGRVLVVETDEEREMVEGLVELFADPQKSKP